MILTTHAITGAVIGKYSHNLIIIATVSVIIHCAMDILKHGDYYEEKRTFFQGFIKELIDLSIAAILFLIIIYFDKPTKTEVYYMLWGAGWSLLPDFTTVLYDKLNFKFLKPVYKLNRWVHDLFYSDADRVWNLKNLTNDFIISGISIIILLFF